MADSRRWCVLSAIAGFASAAGCGDEEPARITLKDAGSSRIDASRDSSTPVPEAGTPDVPSGPDGSTRGNCGKTAWTARFGGSAAEASFADERGRALAVAPNGELIATGYYDGDADFGGGPRSAGGDNPSMFVARFDANGQHLQSLGFGDPTPGLFYSPQAKGTGVAVDGEGHVLVSGVFAGTVDFGAGPLTSIETLADLDAGLEGGIEGGLGFCFVCNPDAVVFELDATGKTLWSKRYGSANGDGAHGVAVDPQNSVFLAGTVELDVDFGGGNRASLGKGDGFVLKLDTAGAWVWDVRFGGSGEDDATAIAVDGAGNVLVTGTFTETVSFGSTKLSSPGKPDAFVAKLDQSGQWIWAKQLKATNQAFGLGIARDAANAVVAVGAYRGTIDAGGGPVQSAFNDAFVIKLDAGGNHVFTKSFGGVQNDEADGVAVTSDQRIVVTGAVSSDSIDFGGGRLPGGRSDDLFVVTLDPGGAHLCSRRYGSLGGSSAGLGIAVDSANNALVTGAFSGSVNFDSDALMSSGGLDIFLAKFLAD